MAELGDPVIPVRWNGSAVVGNRLTIHAVASVPDVVLPDMEPDVQTKSWIVQFPDGSQAVLFQSSGGTAWVSSIEEA